MRRSLLVTALALAGCEAAESGLPEVRLSLVETLAGADTVGYQRAFEARPFDFPEDHGPHPDFRTEWWYVTGNVTSESGRDFGYQFTIFRSALSPEAPDTRSDWGTNQAYMGHFAVTDVATGEFRAYERFARGAVGLAGAQADPLRVWLEDWTLESRAGTTFPLRLAARGDEVELRVVLERGKPAILQGDRGLSQKGTEPGNASYYYSHTRLPTSGTLVIESDTLEVAGTSWLDREWSTSALSGDQVGWDWFALQIDDGWDLMLYQLRRVDGSADPLSAGVLVDPDGNKRALAWGSGLSLEATATWTSSIDGTTYPSGWRVRLPERGWDLTVEPRVLDQELDVSFRYWEGAVAVDGLGEGGTPVRGRGYVELTGYAGESRGR